MRKIVFIICMLFSTYVYSDCSECGFFMKTIIETKDGEVHKGWTEHFGTTWQTLEAHNGVEHFVKNFNYKNYSDKIKIYGKLIQLRHPEFWSWRPKSLYTYEIPSLEYPFVTFSPLEKMKTVDKMNISKFEMTGEYKKLQPDSRYTGNLIVIKKYLIDQIAREAPETKIVQYGGGNIHYIYSSYSKQTKSARSTPTRLLCTEATLRTKRL